MDEYVERVQSFRGHRRPMLHVLYACISRGAGIDTGQQFSGCCRGVDVADKYSRYSRGISAVDERLQQKSGRADELVQQIYVWAGECVQQMSWCSGRIMQNMNGRADEWVHQLIGCGR